MTKRGRLQDEERGATLVIVALSLIAIFAMVILTVDVGGLLYKRRAMVNGSDSAALAAAFSCARTTDGDIPENVADQYAADNVSGLLASNGGIVSGQTSNCDTGRNGYVTVRYSVPQQLWFAGVLGFGNSATVTTAATAAWGPAGGGNPLPIVLNLATFQGNCDIPNVTKGTKCYLWYDNDRFNGSAFGFMNLSQWGVNPGDNCQAAGSSSLDAWINNNWTGAQLPLNYPSPTYVCSTSGNRDSDWSALSGRIGDILTFPINDQNNEIDCCGNQVDKFDVIGFADLKLDQVLDANQAGGTSGSCSLTPVDFPNASPMDIATAGTSQGCLPLTWDPLQNGDTITNIQLNGKQPNCCTLNQQYRVATNPLNGHPIVTWTGPPPSHSSITVSFDWQVQGPCGPPPSNNSSHCIVVDWQGAQIGGTNPGGGQDFGLESIRLCDLNISGSCPNQ